MFVRNSKENKNTANVQLKMKHLLIMSRILISTAQFLNSQFDNSQSTNQYDPIY